MESDGGGWKGKNLNSSQIKRSRDGNFKIFIIFTSGEQVKMLQEFFYVRHEMNDYGKNQ